MTKRRSLKEFPVNTDLSLIKDYFILNNLKNMSENHPLEPFLPPATFEPDSLAEKMKK
jgi:hypothetical protein